jgi:hypothetical protein
MIKCTQGAELIESVHLTRRDAEFEQPLTIATTP